MARASADSLYQDLQKFRVGVSNLVRWTSPLRTPQIPDVFRNELNLYLTQATVWMRIADCYLYWLATQQNNPVLPDEFECPGPPQNPEVPPPPAPPPGGGSPGTPPPGGGGGGGTPPPPQAPVAHAGGPYSVQVNSVFTADGSATIDPDTPTTSLLFDWNWGDGSLHSVGNGLIYPQHSYSAGGDYTITLLVRDPDNLSSSDTTTVHVSVPEPPVADAGGPYSGTVNTAIVFDGRGSTWSPTWNPNQILVRWQWGDGLPDTTGTAQTSLQPSHIYATTGTKTVTLTITDPLLRTATDTATVQVNAAPIQNLAPVAAFTGPTTITAGVQGTWNATGTTDPPVTGGPCNFNTSQLHYRWNWGDGSLEEAGIAFTVRNHTYATAGTYTIHLVVTEPGPAPCILSSFVDHQVVVNPVVPTNLPPDPEFTGPSALLVGQLGTWDATTTVDPTTGSPCDFTPTQLNYSWDWGDGSLIESGLGSAGYNIRTHTYAAAATRTITLTVTEPGPPPCTLSASVQHSVVVSAVPPTNNTPVPSFTGPGTREIGQAGTWTAIATTDPPSGGPCDFTNLQLNYSWNWGDGSPIESGLGSNNYITRNHTYNTAGTKTITLTVTEPGSAPCNLFASTTRTVIVTTPPVANQAPIPAFTGPTALDVGQQGTWDASATADPQPGSACDFTNLQLNYRWNWGDGSVEESGLGSAGYITRNHTYNSASTFPITLIVSEPGPAPCNLSASVQHSVVVSATVPPNGGPPDAKIDGPSQVNAGDSNTWTANNTTDTGNNPTPLSEMRFTYDWGDGSPTEGGIGVLSRSHVYDDPGTYVQRLTVNDMHPTNPLEDFDDDTITVGTGGGGGGGACPGPGCSDYTKEGGTGIAEDGSFRLGGTAWVGFCVRGNFCSPSEPTCGETNFQRLTTGPAGEMKIGNRGEADRGAATVCRQPRGTPPTVAGSNWVRWDLEVKFDPNWVDQQTGATPDTGGGKHLFKVGKAPGNCNTSGGGLNECDINYAFRFDWNPVGTSANGGISVRDGLGCQMYVVYSGAPPGIRDPDITWLGSPTALRSSGIWSQANTWYKLRLEHRYEPALGKFSVVVVYNPGQANQVTKSGSAQGSGAINMPYNVGANYGFGNFDWSTAVLSNSSWGYCWVRNLVISRLD